MYRSRIDVTIDNHIARLTLSRPEKHNALDLDMFLAIDEARKSLAAEPGLRAVVMSGAGVDVCSGLDVKSMMSNRKAMRKLLWKWLPWRSNLAQAVSTGWRELPVPVIAAVHGRCWGGGLQIALGADFRILHPEACLSVMEGKWGLIPDMGGTLALRELVPRDQAAWLAMSAEPFDAQRALDLGLATALSERPEDTSMEWAMKLSDRSPDALAALKKLYRKSWHGSAGAALARESLYQVRILAGKNQRIAVERQRGSNTAYRPPRRW